MNQSNQRDASPEQVEWAVDLRDNLEAVEASARIVIIMLEKFIDGEISLDEYEGWVDEHEHLMENFQL